MPDGVISPVSHEQLITKRASELMRREMSEAFFTPWSPAWGDKEVAIRERCRKQAEDEIDAMHPVVGRMFRTMLAKMIATGCFHHAKGCAVH